MIAVDTSTLIAYLAGERWPDVEALDTALAYNRAHLPPAIATRYDKLALSFLDALHIGAIRRCLRLACL